MTAAPDGPDRPAPSSPGLRRFLTASGGAAGSRIRSMFRSPDLQTFIQTLIFGLALGGVIAISAVGLTLSYGVTRFINFAYGEFLTLGAYFTIALVSAGRACCRRSSSRCCWSGSPACAGADLLRPADAARPAAAARHQRRARLRAQQSRADGRRLEPRTLSGAADAAVDLRAHLRAARAGDHARGGASRHARSSISFCATR